MLSVTCVLMCGNFAAWSRLLVRELEGSIVLALQATDVPSQWGDQVQQLVHHGAAQCCRLAASKNLLVLVYPQRKDHCRRVAASRTDRSTELGDACERIFSSHTCLGRMTANQHH